MSLNPKINKDASGTYWLEWTPDPTAEGYAFVTPNGRSRSFDPTLARTKLGKGLAEPVKATVAAQDVTVRAAEEAQYPPVVPPDPPPSGIAPPVGPFITKDGGNTQSFAVFSRDPGSPDIGKLDVKNYTGYGVAQMAWNGGPVPSTGTSHIHDIIVRPKIGTNRSQNGTAEAGIWLGQRTLAERLLILAGDWMGGWTGAVFTGTMQDFQILGVPFVGLYNEHRTVDAIFRRFRIESAATGINIEWWYGGEGSRNLTFEDGYIKSASGTAVFVDAGNYGMVFRRCHFEGNVFFPKRLVDPSKPNVLENCTFGPGFSLKYHDNAIGSVAALADVHAFAAEVLHPETIRMPVTLAARLS